MEQFNDKGQAKAWLKQLRLDRGLSAEDAAELAGVNDRTIKNWEATGGGFTHAYSVLRYLTALGVVVDSPVTSPAVGRLEALEAAVDRTGTATEKAIRELSARVQAVERALPNARAKEG